MNYFKRYTKKEEKEIIKAATKVNRVAVIIGHHSQKGGAFTSFKSDRFKVEVSEYFFNTLAANSVPEYAYELEALIFKRNPALGYTAQCKDIAKRVKEAGCQAAISLHCNAGGGSGFEILVADDSILDSEDMRLARGFVDAFNSEGDQTMRRGNGIMQCQDGHNGFKMLHYLNSIAKVPAVLLERCFFDDETNEVRAIVDAPEYYGKLIGETLRKIYL